MRELTAKQNEILNYIIDCYRNEGCIPTMRQIADQFAFRSLNAVNDHLLAIERKGYLVRRPGSRGVVLSQPVLVSLSVSAQSRIELDEAAEELSPDEIPDRRGSGLEYGWREEGRAGRVPGEGAADVPEWEGSGTAQPGIPIIGRVAAGKPVTAVENLDGYLDLGSLYGREHFALHVRGDSMIDDGIWDGDFVIVREQPRVNNGEIAVAVVEGEATVKRVRIAGTRAELVPANELYRPILVDLTTTDFRIAGRVVGVHRVLR